MVMVVVMAEDKPLPGKYRLVVTNNEITATYWQSCMGILSLSINCTVPYFDSTISNLFQSMILFCCFRMNRLIARSLVTSAHLRADPYKGKSYSLKSDKNQKVI